MKIVSGQDMARIDSWAINEQGLPEMLLMENAGRAVAARAQTYLTNDKNQVVIIVGKGNNGGDGLVAARHLNQWGADVRLFLLAAPQDFSQSSKENWRFIENSAIRWYVLGDQNSFYPLKLCLETAAVVIDAMLGNGFRGELRENYLPAAEAINKGRARVIAVDLPTGVEATTGQAAKGAVVAQETVTFAYGKQGLYIYPGRSHAGRVFIEDISIPKEGIELLAQPAQWVDQTCAGELLPRLKADSHKGDYGHLFVVAGSRGMVGAAYLAGKGALRSGAGLLTTVLPETLADGFNLALPEGMVLGAPEERPGFLAAAAAESIIEEAQNAQVMLFGPGLARTEEIVLLLKEILARWDRPLVLDAGGLWALAQDKTMAEGFRGSLVLTPHPGEMAGLLDKTVAEVQKDRCLSVRQGAEAYNCVAILKGASSLIADPQGNLFINSTGNVSLSIAGSGDVLAGAVSAWLGRGLEAKDAAVLAVYLHGLAGDMMSQVMGDRGSLAGEICDYLPLALKELKSDE